MYLGKSSHLASEQLCMSKIVQLPDNDYLWLLLLGEVTDKGLCSFTSTAIVSVRKSDDQPRLANGKRLAYYQT